jgi:lipopolysaccharide/colanic/teichoic acid biosynthesis glycosyltransferase
MKTESIKNVEVESFKLEEIKGYNGIYNKYIKRIFDVLLALLFLILLLPVYLIISLFIIVETGFPVIYKAERGGYNGKNFKIYKFRTMVKNADEIGGGTTALNDPRITKVGNFLRKTKLDEITQIINIIKGEMSFIGPRPELIKYTSQYSGNEEFILMVRPGITDYSSIEFINLDEIVGEDNADEIYEKFVLKKKNQLRIKYAAKVSIKKDLYLFFNTVWRVVQKAIKHIANK